MDNSRCVILVPANHYIEPHCALSLGQLEAMGYPVRRLYGFSQVDVARNRLASDALREGFLFSFPASASLSRSLI